MNWLFLYTGHTGDVKLVTSKTRLFFFYQNSPNITAPMALHLLLDKPHWRRFKSTLKDHLVLPVNKKNSLEGRLWEMDVRTQGKKDYGLIAACCSYNMKTDSTTNNIKFETKERKCILSPSIRCKLQASKTLVLSCWNITLPSFHVSEKPSLDSPGLSFPYAILMTSKNYTYYIFITRAMTMTHWLNFPFSADYED